MNCKNLGLRECSNCQYKNIGKYTNSVCDVQMYIKNINAAHWTNEQAKNYILYEIMNNFHYTKHYLAALKLSNHKDLFDKLVVLA